MADYNWGDQVVQTVYHLVQGSLTIVADDSIADL